jgi:hypothetical protein
VTTGETLMARGFDSKAVADQQESASAPTPARDDTPADTASLAKRRRLELSRADVKRRLATAQAPAHRQMLERALVALEDEIASLP